jgi:hypothetical protein
MADTITADTLPEGPVRDLFTSREELRKIFRMACTMRVSPEAFLVNTLARVLAHTAPHVVLPPVIGTAASLNLGVENDGFIQNQVCRDPATAVTDCGSVTTGEGIANIFDQRAYTQYLALLDAEPETDKDGNPKPKKLTPVPRPADRAIFTEDEGNTLRAVAMRPGASVVPVLTKALTGSSLSTNGASVEAQRDVPTRSYRMVYSASIQPAYTDWILDDAGSGFPQRFVWADASTRYNARREFDPEKLDPNKYHSYGNGDAPLETLDVCLPWEVVERRDLPADTYSWSDPRTAARQVPIEFPETVTARLEFDFDNMGDATTLASHRNLTALKLAAGFALLREPEVVESPHGGVEIRATNDDWELAQVLMDLSDGVQTTCRTACSGTRQAQATAEEKLRTTAREQAEEAREQDIRDKILALAAEGGQYKGRGGMRARSRRFRFRMDGIVRELLDSGEIIEDGNNLRLGTGDNGTDPTQGEEPAAAPAEGEAVPVLDAAGQPVYSGATLVTQGAVVHADGTVSYPPGVPQPPVTDAEREEARAAAAARMQAPVEYPSELYNPDGTVRELTRDEYLAHLGELPPNIRKLIEETDEYKARTGA